MSVLLKVEHLKKYFHVPAGINHAVDDVSFQIKRGETVGIVGESGCGKSTLGRTIIRLEDATDGKIYLDGKDITHLKGKELRKVRENMQIIFQDPYSSLNPRMTVQEAVQEPLLLSRRYKRSQMWEESERLMELCGIEKRLQMAYPHELDGGRRQRVGIARALALKPEFIMCDEPVSALDVSIQAQVLNLLMDLQEKMELTYIFVTHDLSVVRHISNTICVMYLGQMVESAPSKELFANPMHPYTKALLSAIPSVNLDVPMKRIMLKGEITSPINPGAGCRFAARCPYAGEDCDKPQSLEEVSKEHFVSCSRIREL